MATQADADVCAFLCTVDQHFNPQKELEILKDEKRMAEWQAEMDRIAAIRAREIANHPMHGVRTFPVGAVGARFRQEIANDPTLSTRQALTNATNAIIMPGSLDFVMGSNPTGTTGTTSTTGTNSGSTRATGRNVPTTNDTAVYVADTLGNTDITTSSSSSTATKTGANGQTLLGTEGQDEGGKMSKAKKKREGRKRAKFARAQMAGEKVEGSVGNDDDDDNDDDNGEAPDTVDA